MKRKHWKLFHIHCLIGTSGSGIPAWYTSRPLYSFLSDLVNTHVVDVFLSIWYLHLVFHLSVSPMDILCSAYDSGLGTPVGCFNLVCLGTSERCGKFQIWGCFAVYLLSFNYSFTFSCCRLTKLTLLQSNITDYYSEKDRCLPPFTRETVFLTELGDHSLSKWATGVFSLCLLMQGWEEILSYPSYYIDSEEPNSGPQTYTWQFTYLVITHPKTFLHWVNFHSCRKEKERKLLASLVLILPVLV